MCFALIFNIPFTVVANRARGYSRFTSILDFLGLREYLLDGEDDLQRNEQLPPIDWNEVNAKIQQMRVISIDWLRKALASPVPPQSMPTAHAYQLFLRNKSQTTQKSRDITKSAPSHLDKNRTIHKSNTRK